MNALQLVQNLNEDLAGEVVVSNAYGQGTLKSITGTCTKDLIAVIDFDCGSKKFCLGLAYTKNSLQFVDAVAQDSFIKGLTSLNEFDAEFEDNAQKLAEELAQKRREAYDKMVADKAAKKAAERFEASRDAAIRKFNMLEVSPYKYEGPQARYYQDIGWLAAHVGAVTAKLPDYLDKAFTKHFGSDAPRTCVDSKQKTTGGYKYQWSYAFSAYVKKSNRIPSLIRQHMNTAGTRITDTAFIWNMVDNHGFQFGTEQNIDKIRSSVPDDMLEFFDLGYAS